MKTWVKSYGLAIGLLGVALALTLFLVKHRTLSKSDEAAVLAMESLKDSIQKILIDPRALEATVRLNANRFSCLSTSEDCAGKVGLFLLYGLEKNSPIPFSQISDEKGFSLERAGCSDFPSVKCPLRVEASWRPAGEAKNCEARRPLHFHVRVVLNSGSIFLDWKTEKVSTVQIEQSREAHCKCQGLTYLAGECRSASTKETAQAAEVVVPDSDQLRLEEERKEREIANAAQSDPNAAPECPSIISFRNEEFAVVDVNPKGETQIELEGEDNRCESTDLFRFQCAMKLEAGVSKGEWVFAGVEKGSCSLPETSTTVADDASPATNEPQERAPASETNPEVLEVKQGILNEE